MSGYFPRLDAPIMRTLDGLMAFPSILLAIGFASIFSADNPPLLISVGRLDMEKRPDVVVEAFQRLPAELGARLAIIGEGPQREQIAALGDPRIVTPGYLKDRAELAKWLASADIYVSAMADETFGVSIVEAQASGLPVVGVAAGAMIDRVPERIGRLGPVGDTAAMAQNILAVWNGDRATMRTEACNEARLYSWDRSMEALFGRVYPAALGRGAQRYRLPEPGLAASLAKA
jgi:alpha-1,6-mannosyltransferase